MTAVSFRDLSLAYQTENLSLRDVSLEIQVGARVGVVGASGSGKSSLLRTVNGIAPHLTGGELFGDVSVFGRSTRNTLPRDFARTVGFIHQDPEAQTVSSTVLGELMFTLQNLGSRSLQDADVLPISECLGISHLLNRQVSTLSGGERQRVAIAASLIAKPTVLVLDEPTSQLDPQGAAYLEELFRSFTLWEELTMLLSEHRIDRVAPLLSNVLWLDQGFVRLYGSTEEVLASYPGAPTSLKVAQTFGIAWSDAISKSQDPSLGSTFAPVAQTETGDFLLGCSGLSVTYPEASALKDVTLNVSEGEVVALVGANGSGKTTLLQTLAGLRSQTSGVVTANSRVSYVPQNPNFVLCAQTVRQELRYTQKLLKKRDDAAVDQWLEALGLSQLQLRHPRSLSGGERQRVSVAAVAVSGSKVLLLDEPTRGMDTESAVALECAIRNHVKQGGSVILATHDAELVARVASRVIYLQKGQIVADGTPLQVLPGTMYEPFVHKICPGLLTIDQLRGTAGVVQ